MCQHATFFALLNRALFRQIFWCREDPSLEEHPQKCLLFLSCLEKDSFIVLWREGEENIGEKWFDLDRSGYRESTWRASIYDAIENKYFLVSFKVLMERLF